MDFYLQPSETYPSPQQSYSVRQEPDPLDSIRAAADALAESFAEQTSGQSLRVIVLDFVDSDDSVTAFTRYVTEEVRIAITNEQLGPTLLERQMLDSAVQETQFSSYLLANDQDKYANLAQFAPADLVIAGQVFDAAGELRLIVRAFSTSDGSVVFGHSSNLGVVAAKHREPPTPGIQQTVVTPEQPQSPVGANSDPYFTTGSPAATVLRIMGDPTSVSLYEASRKEVWYYGYSTVTFELPSRTVLQWDDSSHNLKAELISAIDAGAARDAFTLGSSDRHVVAVQGTPDSIDVYQASRKEIWHYGYSSVTFSLPGRVVQEWDDSDGRLRKTLVPDQTHNETVFGPGSPDSLVLALQGTPDSINVYSASRRVVWGYGYSSVTFRLPEMTVVEWDTSDVPLKARMR